MVSFFIVVFSHHADVIFEFLPEALWVGGIMVRIFTLETVYIVLEFDALCYDVGHEFFILEGGKGPGSSARSDVWGISGGIFYHD